MLGRAKLLGPDLVLYVFSFALDVVGFVLISQMWWKTVLARHEHLSDLGEGSRAG